MKKELLSFKNLLKFILIILFLLSLSFIVEYNVKEYDKQKKNISNVVKESYSFLKNTRAEEIPNTNELEEEEKVKTNILNELKDNEYTISSPLIINNPYNRNPLSAYIAFNTLTETTINVVINNEYSYTSAFTKTHILPVYYLLPEDNVITLNDIEIHLDMSLEYTTIDNNTNNLLFIYNDTLKAYKASKLVMSLNISDSNYKLLSNGNILYKDNNKLIEITPYGYITNIYYIGSEIIDYNIDSSNLYVLTRNSLLKVNKITKEEFTYEINNPTKLELTDNLIVISDSNNIIYFLNKGLGLEFIFGESTNLKDYMLKKNYYTKYLTNIKDFIYKDNYLYVIDDFTLRILLINESNKTIRQYKTISNINSNSITFEDKLILNNIVIENNRVTNTLNIDSSKSYIKNLNININESTNIYYSNSISNFNALDDKEVSSFDHADTTILNITKIDNKLILNNKVSSIILLNEKGYSYEYILNDKNIIDISSINEGKYFIYTKIDSKVYNINRYIVKR